MADLLREAGIEPRVVLDLTYGMGLFWRVYRPRLIIGVDPFPENSRLWVVAPDVYCPRAAWQWEWCVKPLLGLGVRIDLVAVDPPWTTQPSSRRRLYGKRVGTVRLILEAAAAAAAKLQSPLLVHYKSRWVPEGFEVLAERLFRAVYRAKGRDETTWFAVMKPV